MKTKGTIERCFQLIQARETEQALSELLQIWRERKFPEIAEVIDEISAELTNKRPKIEGKKVKERLEIWESLAKQGDPADFGRLAEALFLTKSARSVVQRMQLLSEWKSDPRLSNLFHGFLEQFFYTAPTSRIFWDKLFEILITINDPRSLSALAEAIPLFSQKWPYNINFRYRMVRAAQQTQSTLQKQKQDTYVGLNDSEKEFLRKIRQILKRTSAKKNDSLRRDLLNEVYNNPDDDSPRLVLADLLLEEGDPRGEFIILQCQKHRGKLTKKQRSRELELLATYQDDWLGDISYFLNKKNRKFQRGFLIGCELGAHDHRQKEYPLNDPQWRLVENIILCYFTPIELFEKLTSLLKIRMEVMTFNRLITFDFETSAREIHITNQYSHNIVSSWKNCGRLFPNTRILKVDSFGVFRLSELRGFVNSSFAKKIEWLEFSFDYLRVIITDFQPVEFGKTISFYPIYCDIKSEDELISLISKVVKMRKDIENVYVQLDETMNQEQKDLFKIACEKKMSTKTFNYPAV